jgi:hypothetical protein
MQSFEGLFGTSQGFLYVLTNILGTDEVRELRLLDELQGLLPGSAENQLATACFQRARDFFQGEEPGGIECGHIAEAQNHDWGEIWEFHENECRWFRRGV